MKFLKLFKRLTPIVETRIASTERAPDESGNLESKRPDWQKLANPNGPYWKMLGRKFNDVLGNYVGWISPAKIKGDTGVGNRDMYVFEKVRFLTSDYRKTGGSKVQSKIPYDRWTPNTSYEKSNVAYHNGKWYSSKIHNNNNEPGKDNTWESMELNNYDEQGNLEVAKPGDVRRTLRGMPKARAEQVRARITHWATNDDLPEEYMMTAPDGSKKLRDDRFINDYGKRSSTESIKDYIPNNRFPYKDGWLDSESAGNKSMKELVSYIRHTVAGKEPQEASKKAEEEHKERRESAVSRMKQAQVGIFRLFMPVLKRSIFSDVKSISEPKLEKEPWKGDSSVRIVAKDDKDERGNYRVRQQVSDYVRSSKEKERLSDAVVKAVRNVDNEAMKQFLKDMGVTDNEIRTAFGLTAKYVKSASNIRGGYSKGTANDRLETWLLNNDNYKKLIDTYMNSDNDIIKEIAMDTDDDLDNAVEEAKKSSKAASDWVNKVSMLIKQSEKDREKIVDDIVDFVKDRYTASTSDIIKVMRLNTENDFKDNDMYKNIANDEDGKEFIKLYNKLKRTMDPSVKDIKKGFNYASALKDIFDLPKAGEK